MATSLAPMLKLVYANGKQLAWQVFLETMASIDVGHAMQTKVAFQGKTLAVGAAAVPLSQPPRVIAFGKAANRMAASLDRILGGESRAGVVVSPSEPDRKISRFRYFVGGHPYPTQGSLDGARAAIELVTGLAAEDVVVFLVSGGGSALFETPIDPAITLGDLVEFNRVLVTCGLPIEQINVLRKHVSAVKGGRLGLAAHPARRLTIYISDVPAGCDSMVASGPTMPDESTVEQSVSIVEDRSLVPRFPARIRSLFAARKLEETPKPGDPRFGRSDYCCLLSNRDAVEAARANAEKLGFAAEVDSGDWDRDYHDVVEANLAALDRLARSAPGRPVCLVAGGEVISPVTGHGSGGRNQAFVLEAARRIGGARRVVLSAGTDGRDGNSPVAGALADGHTLGRATALGLDPDQSLASSDSYHFFSALGDTIETGFTDNNVRDVRLWLDFGKG